MQSRWLREHLSASQRAVSRPTHRGKLGTYIRFLRNRLRCSHFSQGDWIEVRVKNNIPDEGTSIHWHGLLQKNTQYMDGTPGVSQCPIAPGSEFTYRFQADLYGTSW